MNKLNIIARKLRKNQTPQEQILWNILRNRQVLGYKFRRQYPIGNYVVDFVCKENKMIIEIDGGQHNTPEGILADENRTKYLQSVGYKILRFWNNEIDNNIEGVYQKIIEQIENIKTTPHPNPLPSERE